MHRGVGFFELAGSHKARDNGRSRSVPSSVHAGALRNRIMFSAGLSIIPEMTERRTDDQWGCTDGTFYCSTTLSSI